ncbi:hypothetical protein [Caldivirga sp.]|uniref:hypothetical protein n=1 Tax=Caldivirga sp. TaxID=2080243 RepID=UPI003D12FE09
MGFTIDKRFTLLGFSMSTTAPLVLATLHEPVLISVSTALLTLPLALIVYLYVNDYWGLDGLFHYVSSVSMRLGSVQLYSWLLSYFLYIIYTVDYVDYMVLKLPDSVSNALTIVLPVVFSIIVVAGLSYLVLLALSLAQVILALPIPQLGWVRSMAITHTALPQLFINILSSSLLIVCITLVPYADGDTQLSRYVIYVFVLSSALMIVGSFFKASLVITQLTSLGYIGLILAEYTALYNLLYYGLGFKRSKLIIPALVILLDAASLINYNEFYNITIVPSVAALYLTLLISLLTVPFYLNRSKPLTKALNARYTHIVLSIVASLIMAYGAYTVLTQSTGVSLYEAVMALITPTLLGIVRPLTVNNTSQPMISTLPKADGNLFLKAWERVINRVLDSTLTGQ